MYLASSIVKALRKNKDLFTIGLEKVACPSGACIDQPETCSKGQQGACVRKAEIVYEHDGLNKVVVLVFHFQMQGHKREGYISEDDLALKLLFDRGILDKDDLTSTNNLP